MLIRCAGTALNSKLISSQKDLFAPMVVEAVSNLDQQLLALSLVCRWSGCRVSFSRAVAAAPGVCLTTSPLVWFGFLPPDVQ